MAKGKYAYWLTPDGLLRLEAYARDGLTDKQISHNIGITEQTLNVWKKNYPSFFESLKRGKEVIDIEVENALLKRAMGYRYKETTRERIIDTGQKQRHGGESELTEKDWCFAIKYFGNRCCYCGEVMEKPTKDHIKPLNDGGRLVKENVVPCCQHCNSSKKDNEMVSWYQSQKFYNEYRLQKIYDYVQFLMDIGIPDDELGELVVTKEVVKEVQPDTTAQIFWLKNRKPEQWRDKQDIEHSGGVDVRNVYNNMTEEELMSLAKKYEKINSS